MVWVHGKAKDTILSPQPFSLEQSQKVKPRTPTCRPIETDLVLVQLPLQLCRSIVQFLARLPDPSRSFGLYNIVGSRLALLELRVGLAEPVDEGDVVEHGLTKTY